MRKNIIRILTFVLVLVTLFSLSVPAFAAKVSSVNMNASATGYISTFFYVTVPANKAGKVKLTMGKGTVCVNPARGATTFNLYASYEIKVWRYVNGSWKKEQDFDAYQVSSKTISFSKYSSAQKYKVQVYQWRTKTTLDSYCGYDFYFTLGAAAAGGVTTKAYWTKLPTCVAKNSSNCTLYNSCP